MLPLPHYHHGNATEIEIKNEFQTELEKQWKMVVAKQAATKKRSAKGKRSGGESKEAIDARVVWRMSSEVMGKQLKYTGFASFGITFDNIVDACQRYFAAL